MAVRRKARPVVAGLDLATGPDSTHYTVIGEPDVMTALEKRFRRLFSKTDCRECEGRADIAANLAAKWDAHFERADRAERALAELRQDCAAKDRLIARLQRTHHRATQKPSK